MRDEEAIGAKPLWPYFQRQKDISRLRNGDLIPVNSCWNGMTVFDAKWFVSRRDSLAMIEGDRQDTQDAIEGQQMGSNSVSHSSSMQCVRVSPHQLDIHLRSTQRPLIFINPKSVASK